MKKTLLASAVFLACSAAQCPLQAAVDGNLNLFLGRKSLDSQWAPSGPSIRQLTEQGEAGLMFDIGGARWPVHLAVDLLGAKSEDEDFSIETREFHLGFRKYFGDSASGTPYMGGGLARVAAELDEGSSAKLDGAAGGYWVEGGILFHPFPHFNLGMDVKYSNAEVELDQFTIRKAGGIHAGLLLGYQF